MLDTIYKYNIQIIYKRINAFAKLLRKFQNRSICVIENVISIQICVSFGYFVV